MSYLNVYDTEAAWRLVHRFGSTACVIVKHANPCGVAVDTGGLDVAEVYRRANACDPVSAFGGIVAVNRDVTAAMAEALGPVFTEVVVAPGYEPAALATLTARRNLRVLEAPRPAPWRLDVRPVDGGLLVQTPDPVDVDPAAWSVVTARAARAAVSSTTSRWPGRSAPRSARTPSCSPPTARPSASVGVSPTASTRHGSPPPAPAVVPPARVAASDAFFPFRDGIDVARRGRRGGDRPAGWQRPRRRGDRRRRRVGPRHGVHRRAPLPSLTPEPPAGRWVGFGDHGTDLRPVGPRPHLLVRVLPASRRCHAAHARTHDRRARTARAELRVGHLRRRRLEPRAHPQHRHVGGSRDGDHADGPPHVPGPQSRRDHRAARRLPRRRHREHHGPRRRPAGRDGCVRIPRLPLCV